MSVGLPRRHFWKNLSDCLPCVAIVISVEPPREMQARRPIEKRKKKLFKSPKQKQRRHVSLNLKPVVALEHVRPVLWRGRGGGGRSGRHGREKKGALLSFFQFRVFPPILRQTTEFFFSEVKYDKLSLLALFFFSRRKSSRFYFRFFPHSFPALSFLLAHTEHSNAPSQSSKGESLRPRNKGFEPEKGGIRFFLSRRRRQEKKKWTRRTSPCPPPPSSRSAWVGRSLRRR